jgi:redox-sensitive bicupin YhaK (pirin superfamily)
MKNTRRIARVLKARPTIEGAGVHLKRVFGYEHVPQLDPFLMLDEFHSDSQGDYIKGFPWHPHRGIETITALLQGIVEHGDSMGNQGVINPGDVQWMTAGSGIVHQEMPKGDRNGRMWGFQLWANLPASHKMMDPRYRDVKSADIPEVMMGKAKVLVVCGKTAGTGGSLGLEVPAKRTAGPGGNEVSGRTGGPVRGIVTDPEYLVVTIPPGGAFTRSIPSGYTAFAYVFDGSGRFCESRDSFDYPVEGRNYFDFPKDGMIKPETLVLFDRSGDVVVSAEKDGLRFLLISGKPIGEPVAWYGPVVMNTQEELRTAFDEYEKGTFLKHKPAGTDKP